MQSFQWAAEGFGPKAGNWGRVRDSGFHTGYLTLVQDHPGSIQIFGQ